MEQIADLVGCAVGTIQRNLTKAGVNRRSLSEARKIRNLQ